MRFGKRGNLWVWFWILVALVLGGIGLYLLISNALDVNSITSVGRVP